MLKAGQPREPVILIYFLTVSTFTGVCEFLVILHKATTNAGEGPAPDNCISSSAALAEGYSLLAVHCNNLSLKFRRVLESQPSLMHTSVNTERILSMKLFWYGENH